MQTFTLLNGKLLMQDVPPRPSEDALWLAASLPPLAAQSTVLDAGTGCGVAALALLTRQPHLNVTAVDINPHLTALAHQNAQLNNLPLTTLTADILTNPPPGGFKAILCNPPYHAEDRGHQTPNTGKQQAHTLRAGDLPRWLHALTHLLTPTGTLYLILHSACEAELTAFATSHRLTITPLQTSAGRPAKRILATLQNSATPQVIHHSTLQAFHPEVRRQALSAT